MPWFALTEAQSRPPMLIAVAHRYRFSFRSRARDSGVRTAMYPRLPCRDFSSHIIPRSAVDHQLIARVLLATFCGLQGTATAAIDLSRTHAKHPAWPGHARFHVVWQTANVLVLSVFEIALISMSGPLATY